MGYSCSQAADRRLQQYMFCIAKTGRGTESSNCWKDKGKTYFYEIGRENKDGAITGSVSVFVGESHARKVGSFRIEPDGTARNIPDAWKQAAIELDYSTLTERERHQCFGNYI